MNKESKVLGLVGIATKAGKISFGAESVKDAINKHRATLVIVANDASIKTIENFKFICEKNKILFLKFSNIEALSKSIGKPNKAIISINDKNFSEEINKIICGGEAIG